MNGKILKYDNIFKEYLLLGAKYTDKYELPILEKVDFLPEHAIPFDKARVTKNYNQWVHFYLDDFRFECVWNKPRKYLDMFRRFQGIITPDYSMYRMLPLAMQIWNTYRNRAIAYWLQKNGLNIIPNIRWGDERTYDFAFDGIPKGGTVATSTNGCIQKKEDRQYFIKGLNEMIKTIQPARIVNYSQTPDSIFLPYKKQGIEIIHLKNWHRIVKKEIK